MPLCKAIPCITKGCLNYAADDIRYSGMCPVCYRKDCEEGQEDALQMNKNMQRFGSINEPQIVTDACHLVTDRLSGLVPMNQWLPTAAASLARVTIMLGLYGNKAEAILHVIHEHGHTEVTLADVEAVREFVLEKCHD